MCLFVCLFADISEITITRATKFGMLIPHIKGAYYVKGIFEILLYFWDIKFWRFSAISAISKFIYLRQKELKMESALKCIYLLLFIHVVMLNNEER